MLTPGRVLQNRYRIIRQIGGGGMGTVYLAEDLRLPGRRCAVKEMSPALLSLQDRPWAIQAFQQEAHLLASLSHPNLAAVTDFFQEGENWYLVMEFVEGRRWPAAWSGAPAVACRSRKPSPSSASCAMSWSISTARSPLSSSGT